MHDSPEARLISGAKGIPTSTVPNNMAEAVENAPGFMSQID